MTLIVVELFGWACILIAFLFGWIYLSMLSNEIEKCHERIDELIRGKQLRDD